MPGIPLEWRENCTYAGLAQWKEYAATNRQIGVRLPYPVPTERARAESVFFIFTAPFSDFILTDSR